MAEMTPEVWDDELCHTMRLPPETTAAALACEAAALRAENAYLRRAFADAVGELAVSEAQASELRAALEPLAALDAPGWCPDDKALNIFVHTITFGNVRRAKRALGEDDHGNR